MYTGCNRLSQRMLPVADAYSPCSRHLPMTNLVPPNRPKFPSSTQDCATQRRSSGLLGGLCPCGWTVLVPRRRRVGSRHSGWAQRSPYRTPLRSGHRPEKHSSCLQWGMRERFPQAFRLLALDALATLQDVRDKHARQKERGEGWYLVARPARPDWPVTLETAATEAAQSEPDLAAATIELGQLRPLEAQESYPSTLGEALFEATRELGWLLQKHRPELVFDAVIRQSSRRPGR